MPIVSSSFFIIHHPSLFSYPMYVIGDTSSKSEKRYHPVCERMDNDSSVAGLIISPEVLRSCILSGQI